MDSNRDYGGSFMQVHVRAGIKQDPMLDTGTRTITIPLSQHYESLCRVQHAFHIHHVFYVPPVSAGRAGADF